ncbi:tetratricopeptide repeat-containing sulfotransferase family protein [Methylotenera sp. G11]|uniref:tetratricopeptide repeat-containing sulfotransferase family protein n=1 Tax=Methylotenera sp. G11 TaxID=1506585 RepID=UPI00068BB767|nr:tetratricopeptide repeat-containing sulfotransferase family protein [Methylotenera sp. G11]
MKQYTQQQFKFINENFQQGQRAMQMGMFGRAEKYFADIIKIAPEIIEAQNALALTYAATKQHDKAAAQFKVILRAKPNDAHTHHNLANTLYELSQFEEAIQHYQAALKINPNLVDSNIHCGIAYRAIKNYDEAIKCLHQALNLDKKSARAFHILGVIYAELDDYPRTLECLQNASGLAPMDADINISYADMLAKVDLNGSAAIKYMDICNRHPNLLKAFTLFGKHLVNMRYYDEALQCYDRALQLGANGIDTLDTLGKIYLGMGNVDAAIDNYNKALAIEPSRLSSLIGLEQAYQDDGKLDKAISICDEIIATHGDSPKGYLLKSGVLKSQANDGIAENLLRFINQDNLDESFMVDINFALGKIYDDQKNYKQAFHHYALANSIKSQKLSYDREESEASFTKLIETYNTDFFKNRQTYGTDSKLPILIIGMPRSATTLTEQIISSHPSVLGAGEVEFWSDTVNSLHYILNSKSSYPECVQDMLPAHAKEIAATYESTLLKTTGASAAPVHITDKMPHNFMSIGLIATIFPNAKIIHTKRDPVDTCLSIFFQHFNEHHSYAFDLSNLGFYYKQYERLMQHWHTVLPGRIMDIHYADTIADPEYWTRKLISHIGLEWDDACLAPHKLERSVKTPSHWQVRQPIYKTSVQRWKNYEPYIQPLIDALNVNTR